MMDLKNHTERLYSSLTVNRTVTIGVKKSFNFTKIFKICHIYIQ